MLALPCNFSNLFIARTWYVFAIKSLMLGAGGDDDGYYYYDLMMMMAVAAVAVVVVVVMLMPIWRHMVAFGEI